MLEGPVTGQRSQAPCPVRREPKLGVICFVRDSFEIRIEVFVLVNRWRILEGSHRQEANGISTLYEALETNYHHSSSRCLTAKDVYCSTMSRG